VILQLHISVANPRAVIRQFYVKTKQKKNQNACSIAGKEDFNKIHPPPQSRVVLGRNNRKYKIKKNHIIPLKALGTQNRLE